MSLINRRTLKLYREFKALKKNRHLLSDEDYVKELQKRLDDFNADIEAPELSQLELGTLIRLVSKEP